MDNVLADHRPNRVLVHVDTITMAASLAAFYCQTSVAHVEAGLRTYNLLTRWPEEGNRQVTGLLAILCFAPNEASRQNLLRERVDSETNQVTRNTVIDAFLNVSQRLDQDADLSGELTKRIQFLASAKRMVLATANSREKLRAGYQAFKAIASVPSFQVVYPVH